MRGRITERRHVKWFSHQKVLLQRVTTAQRLPAAQALDDVAPAVGHANPGKHE